ncbi:YjjG family noncanonical pyrimidine nucleotidase [Draconibacterium halophilum]|uniref:Noncanonical pyrimidine nucleotidase, YjjG family n=1 Tax=Draconibacterium halophilum TaxID=2706887 RepID=A0A6C0R9T8_9BACT|nr:YjjG family noncanonical pyrimidine nucleotidase [Draconibacterium halophilum]QIA07298.1 noncanonical pyrimidine nucleotidase, YjjG family [Draconibacterium halophilum]
MKKKYTHIFFDLDNTLWDFKTNSKLAMELTFSHFNLELKGVVFEHFFDVYTEHNAKLWAAYRMKEIAKKDLTRQRFLLTLKAFKLNGVDPDKMNTFYLNEMPKQKMLMPGAIELLDFLKKKKVKLFIITNGFKEVQHRKMQRSGLAPYFDKVFISEEVKCPKPGKQIFEHAIKSANAKKTNSLMVGDDWDSDIRGALNFGIDAVYYNPLKQPVDIIIGGVKIINSLSELRLECR